jgi:hypothetical protein
MPEDRQVEQNRLFARAFDQRLEENEAERLEQLLSEDAAAREQYVQLAILQSFIEQEHQAAALDAEFRRMPAIGPSTIDCESARPARQQTESRNRWLGLTAAAAMSIGLALAVLYWRSLPGTQDSTAAPTAYAAKVIGAEQCRWEEPRLELRHGDVLYAQQVVCLAEGVARLRFGAGTEIAVAGPAKLELLGDNSMTLYEGRLIAHVFGEGVGFTVHTPDADVVDLGTRFGLAVDHDGATEAHVFEGEIEMKARGEMTETLAGSAVRVAGSGFQIDDASPEKFAALTVDGRVEVIKSGGDSTTCRGDEIAYGDGCTPEHTVSLRNHALTSDARAFGQYAVGSFTAADTSLQLTIRSLESHRKVIFLSRYVLRRVME